MKRLLMILFVTLVVSGFASAQVLTDFEAGLGGFQNNAWGTAMTSVTQVADPTSRSVGVMQLSMNFGAAGDKGAAGVSSPVTVKDGRLVRYWVYVPTGFPDSIQFGVYAQDNVNWVWNETLTYALDIPKDTWYPLSFDLAAAYAKNPNFDIVNGKLNTGLQINSYSYTAGVPTWTGNVLVDDFTLIGVKPTMVADFESALAPYQNNAWGTAMTGVTQVADPTSKSVGVMQLAMSFSGSAGDKGAAGVASAIDVKVQKFITYWVYVPTGMPGAFQIGVYAQDNVNWVWNEKITNVSDIPKDTWYPLTFDLEAAYAKNHNFDIINGKLFTGLQINSYSAPTTAWTGNILVDNVATLNEKVAANWVVADFEAPAGGLYGFQSQSWGPAAGTPVAMADPTGLNTTRVLNVPALFTGTNGKFVISKDNIAIKSAVDNSIATAIAFDIYLPSDYPDGCQIGAVYSGPATKTNWLEDLHYTYGADSLKKGQWNTIRFNVAHHDSLGELVDSLTATFHVQIYFATVPNWTGNLYFDNLTLEGIPAPAGTLASPVTTAMADTTLVDNGNIVHFVRFDWIDNPLGSESYNIYFSKSAIGAITDPGVVKFATNVPHGLQKYAHRPYTSTGATENLYYAVTATDGVTETPLRAECKVGPVSIQSTPTYKVVYDANFKNTFVLDGDFAEFAPYSAHTIVPETAGGDSSYDWTPASTKLNFKVDMVIDDKYLYIAADVSDVEVVTLSDMQAWQGDAIEFFLGAYDIRPLTEWHGKNFQSTNGDWRIGFLANGGLGTNGSASGATVPGLSTSDFVTLGKLTGDGYQIEARLCLDSLAAAPHSVTVTNGMLMPLRIDCNSRMQDTTSRILQCGIGGTPTGGRIDQDQDWTRPQGWAHLEVINGPADVAMDDDGLPKEFKLYTNYPNPFNPSTIIRYDLKQDVQVTLKVYNVLGQEVTTLVNERQKAGRYSARFDGARFASGMYIYQIQAGSFVKAVKMLLLK